MRLVDFNGEAKTRMLATKLKIWKEQLVETLGEYLFACGSLSVPCVCVSIR